ncbi:hypothetical protein BV22DRAFT_1197260 [Leucogyrophana mollusca]|uniref:Uncharacterized protein n=1 Tax=Leucogyrophana mollusca TaxID=85980 RepID=A0ACB8BA05_9AGAM|nr:hypothetical protein BV22DRAFT_1197260 [Leucogyrophana mollusca]
MAIEAGNQVARYITYGASAALLAMFVDYGLTVSAERKYIWSKLRTSSYARTYILARYFGLAAQIFNVCFSIWMATRTYIAPSLCKVWYSYQAVVIQTLVLVVDSLLMLGGMHFPKRIMEIDELTAFRVYTIFSRSYWIISLLVVLAAAQPGSMIASAVITFPEVTYTSTCLIIEIHSGSIYFGTATLTTHVVILFLSLWKCFIEGRALTSLRSAILRDGTLAMIAISIILMFMLLCSLRVIKTGTAGNIIYYWLLATLWVSVGRIIINWETFKADQASGCNSTGGLTTHITVLDNASVYQLEMNASPSVSAHTPSITAPVDEPDKASSA